MAFTLPINPTTGDTYQSGSSPTLVFDGSLWKVQQPQRLDRHFTPTASLAISANSISGSYLPVAAKATNSTSASLLLIPGNVLVESASYATLAEHIPPVFTPDPDYIVRYPSATSFTLIDSGFLGLATTTIPLNATYIQNGGIGISGTNVLIAKSGLYQIVAQLTTQPKVLGNIGIPTLRLIRNGSVVVIAEAVVPGTSIFNQTVGPFHINCLLSLNSGDTLGLQFIQDTGVSITGNGGIDKETFLAVIQKQ